MAEFDFELPDGIRRKLQEQMDQQELMQVVLHQDIDRFFDSLDVEQLAALNTILYSCSGNDKASIFFEGVVKTILRIKFGRCGGCGQEHLPADLAKLGEEHGAD